MILLALQRPFAGWRMDWGGGGQRGNPLAVVRVFQEGSVEGLAFLGVWELRLCELVLRGCLAYLWPFPCSLWCLCCL